MNDNIVSRLLRAGSVGVRNIDDMIFGKATYDTATKQKTVTKTPFSEVINKIITAFKEKNKIGEPSPTPSPTSMPLLKDFKAQTPRTLGLTATSTPTATPHPVSPHNKNPYEDLIKNAFENNANDAMRVISRTVGRKNKVGENVPIDPLAESRNSDGTIDRGLFQINSKTFEDLMKRQGGLLRELGITSFDDMFDPENNILVARILFDQRGWDPWYGAPQDLISDKEREYRIKNKIRLLD